nr:hypothetical protein [Tanacetum cinerariifolium]
MSMLVKTQERKMEKRLKTNKKRFKDLELKRQSRNTMTKAQDQRSRNKPTAKIKTKTQELKDKEFKDLASGEIISLKILSRTRNLGLYLLNAEKHEEVLASYDDLKAAVERFVVEADNNRNNYDIAINSVTGTKMAETNTTSFGNLTDLTELLRNAKQPEIIT